MAYVDPDASYYEERYRERVLHNLHRRARHFGFTLVANPMRPEVSDGVSWEATVDSIGRRNVGAKFDYIECWISPWTCSDFVDTQHLVGRWMGEGR
jgi:hypothetical protein